MIFLVSLSFIVLFILYDRGKNSKNVFILYKIKRGNRKRESPVVKAPVFRLPLFYLSYLFYSRIVLCLCIPQFIIFSIFICYKVCVCSLLYYRAFMKYHNFITKFARRKTMTNIDCCFISCNFIELTIDFSFCDWVKCDGWFI